MFNTRGRSIKVGTSYGSVSQLQTLGSYIVILLNDKSLEESIRLSNNTVDSSRFSISRSSGS